MSPTLHFGNYTIAWIAVLPIEAEAALGMLDNEHDGHFESVRGDDYIYTGGDINEHNVVIATWPAGQNYGVGSAAALVNQVKSRFPNIWFALLVGVAAGLPNLSPADLEKERDIRLGDVLVCVPGQANVGIVQYDLGRDTEDGFLLNGRQTESPSILRSAISNIQLRKKKPFKAGNVFSTYLATFQESSEDDKFSCPSQEYDQLFGEVLEEDKIVQKLIERPARDEAERTKVWYGNVGSGNSLIRNSQRRDKLRDKYDLIGLEMEAAGVMNTLPTGVIRGVCDYGDRQKNKAWQPYAAAVAAVYAKGILYTINPKLAQAKEECPKSLRVLPFGRNRDFVGRQYHVNVLIETFLTGGTEQDCQRVALDGLGGVGKTQIALELVFRIQESSPEYSVFWVRASDADSFEHAYREIGQRLKIPGLDDDKADVKELVRARLSEESAGKWILIVDNADDFGLLYNGAKESNSSRALHEYLPFSPLGAILFTTRDREAATRYAGSNVIRVEEMDEAESRQLLKAGLQNQRLAEDKSGTTKLLKLLVNLPLAIMQAVAYLNAKSATIAEYLEIYEESNENTVHLLSKDFEDRRRYPDMKNPIATTWLISFEQIQLRDPLAAEYIAFMSCVKEQDIPKDLLPIASQLEKSEAIGTLKAFGFIKERLDGNSYDMHRLVHIAMQSWLMLNGKLTLYNNTTLKRIADAFPWPEHENKGTWTRYLPHAQCIIASSNVYPALEEAQWTVLCRVAECYRIIGKYADAEQLHRLGLQLKEQVLGAQHLSTLRSKGNLALVLGEQGNHPEAEQLHRQVLQLKEQVLGVEHPSTLKSKGNLAVELGEQRKYAEAEQLHRQVLQIQEQVLGVKHPSTLESEGNLAIVLRRQGKHTEAEQLYRQVLQLKEQVLGAQHLSTLRSKGNLALVLSEQGNHTEAEQLHRQVLQLKEQALGVAHPSTLKSKDNLAVELGEQRKYAEAEQLHQQVLQIQEQVLGVKHLLTLESEGNLAVVLRRQGKHTKAEQLHRQVLQLKEQVLGAQHLFTLRSKGNLALVLGEQGNHTEAEQLHRQVLQLKEQVLGAQHLSTLRSKGNLALVLGGQGNHTEAEQLHRQVLQLKEQALGVAHPSTLKSKDNLAVELGEQRKYAEAEQLHRQVLQIQEQVLGVEHPSTLESKGNLAVVLRRQGKDTEAKQLLKS